MSKSSLIMSVFFLLYLTYSCSTTLTLDNKLSGSWQMTKITCNGVEKTDVFKNFYSSLILKFEGNSGSIILKGTTPICEYTQVYGVVYEDTSVTITPIGKVVCDSNCSESICDTTTDEVAGKISTIVGTDGTTALFLGTSDKSQPGKLCNTLSAGSTLTDLVMKKL